MYGNVKDDFENFTGIDGVPEFVEPVITKAMPFLPHEYVIDLNTIEPCRWCDETDPDHYIYMNPIDSLKIEVDENMTPGHEWVVHMREIECRDCGSRWESLYWPGTLEMTYDSKKDQTEESEDERRVLKYDGVTP